MDASAIQTTYYSMGIIFMSLFFLGLLIIIGLVIALLIRINRMHKQVTNLVDEFQKHPGEKAAEVVLGFASKIAAEKAKKDS